MVPLRLVVGKNKRDSNHTYTTSKRGPPRDEPAGQAWTLRRRRLLGGWRCGARLTASQMRTHQKLRRPYRGQMRVHFTIWPKRPAASDHEDRRRRKCESERPPTGAGAAASCLPGAICARTSQYARSGRRPSTTWTDEEGSRRPSPAVYRDRECRAAGAADHGEPGQRETP
jgi:hypothetical protein